MHETTGANVRSETPSWSEAPDPPTISNQAPSLGVGSQSPYGRALLIWGTAHVMDRDDVTWIAHIGSCRDDLLFWKSGGRVATGWLGNGRACWESSLDDFARRVEAVYCGSVSSEDTRRILRDYRAAVAYFRTIAPEALSTGASK